MVLITLARICWLMSVKVDSDSISIQPTTGVVFFFSFPVDNAVLYFDYFCIEKLFLSFEGSCLENFCSILVSQGSTSVGCLVDCACNISGELNLMIEERPYFCQ